MAHAFTDHDAPVVAIRNTDRSPKENRAEVRIEACLNAIVEDQIPGEAVDMVCT